MKVSQPLTALHLHATPLLIEWVLVELHRAGDDRGHPLTVDYVTVFVHSHKIIGSRDIGFCRHLVIFYEQVRHPETVQFCG